MTIHGSPRKAFAGDVLRSVGATTVEAMTVSKRYV